MKKVTILIPCYNEEASLPLMYDSLCGHTAPCPDYEWEFLFVNDGSRDCTLQIIKQLREGDKRISYVDLSRNFGKEAVMVAGFDYATGDCINLERSDCYAAYYIIYRF